ncbi:MAG: bifunctional metallophosphatase/5'-nucleotidase [Hyphomicrobiaceae bacterium]
MMKDVIRTAQSAVWILVCLVVPATATDLTLTILHINDLHSRIEPINKYDSTCRPKDNVAGKCYGGMARLKTAITTRRDALESAGRHVLTLDAGDQFQGSLFYSTYKGDVAVELMNRIGFDAMVVGNHEFDDGPETLAKFAEKAKFPLLFANTNLANEPLLKDKIKSHIVKDIGGEKVGIIGILAEDTKDLSSPGDNIPFIKSELVLKKLIGQLQADGINKIIVLSHVGFDRDKEIAAAVDGIDVIVGGHSQIKLIEYPTIEKSPSGKPVYIVQAYAHSKYLGELTVVFDSDGNVTKTSGQVWTLNSVVPEDPEFVRYIKEKAKPIEALKAKVIGSAQAKIEGSRKICRARECAMGNLVADAMLDRVKGQGVTIAIQNGGGLRSSIDAGKVTMGDILTVLPFQNTLSTFQLKGRDVVAALENGVSQIERGAGRFPQVAGIKYTFDATAEAGQRVSDVMIKGADGKFGAIEPETLYGVVSNNFLRAGGDGYKIFKTGAKNAYDYGPGLEKVVADYIAAQGTGYKPFTERRITSK